MKKLREMRLSRDLTQDDLCDFLKISRGTYSRYEHGEITISSVTVKKLSEFYNVSADYLLENIEYPLSLDKLKVINELNQKDIEFLLGTDKNYFKKPATLEEKQDKVLELLRTMNIQELRQMLKIIRALNA